MINFVLIIEDNRREARRPGINRLYFETEDQMLDEIERAGYTCGPRIKEDLLKGKTVGNARLNFTLWMKSKSVNPGTTTRDTAKRAARNTSKPRKKTRLSAEDVYALLNGNTTKS